MIAGLNVLSYCASTTVTTLVDCWLVKTFALKETVAVTCNTDYQYPITALYVSKCAYLAVSEIEKHILPNKEFSLPPVTKVDCTHIPNNHHCDHILYNACAGHSPQHVRRQTSEDTVGQNQSKE